MRIEKCYFCSSNVYPGRGRTFVRNDSKIFNFCKSKCYRAFVKKRNPRKVKWTKAYRKAAGKELAVDPIFSFEKRPTCPVRYSRELWNNTVTAMKRIQEIKMKREAHFINKRFAASKAMMSMKDKEEIDKNAFVLDEKPRKEVKFSIKTNMSCVDAPMEEIES